MTAWLQSSRRRTVRASSWIIDHLVAGSPAPIDIAGLSHPLDDVLSAELAAAQADLAATAVEEILLAAFGRAVARTVGDGRLEMDVDVDGDGQPTVGHARLRCRRHRGQYGGRLLTAGREALSGVQPVAAAAPTVRCAVQLPHGAPRTRAGHRPSAGAARLSRPPAG